MASRKLAFDDHPSEVLVWGFPKGFGSFHARPPLELTYKILILIMRWLWRDTTVNNEESPFCMKIYDSSDSLI